MKTTEAIKMFQVILEILKEWFGWMKNRNNPTTVKRRNINRINKKIHKLQIEKATYAHKQLSTTNLQKKAKYAARVASIDSELKRLRRQKTNYSSE